jgi:pyridoxamine 5'-phosphate oxidase
VKEINKHIASLRKDYSTYIFDEKHVLISPFEQLNEWMGQAIKAEIPEVNAVTLSTTGNNKRPSSRIVLLRGFSDQGFNFYTNYRSKKGVQIAENPFGAINIFWHELEKQIRIEGKIEKLSAIESDKYFSSRPKDSQIGAWASEQSFKIKSREELETRIKELSEKYKEQAVPRPPHWGGYILKPDYFEFWQGRASRLHDRISYNLSPNNQWIIERLAP